MGCHFLPRIAREAPINAISYPQNPGCNTVMKRLTTKLWYCRLPLCLAPHSLPRRRGLAPGSARPPRLPASGSQLLGYRRPSRKLWLVESSASASSAGCAAAPLPAGGDPSSSLRLLCAAGSAPSPCCPGQSGAPRLWHPSLWPPRKSRPHPSTLRETAPHRLLPDSETRKS